MSSSSSPKLLLVGAAALLGTAALAAPAHADRRSFTHTYEYTTMSEGETEMEVYSTQQRQEWDDVSAKHFELKLEFEHGITDRWDISLYHVFQQTQGVLADGSDSEALHLEELQLRTRYRFAERGELPVDMLLYVEGVRKFSESVYEAEVKGVFARDFGNLTAVVNLIGEVEFGPDVDEPEVELGWAAGLSYEVVPEWKLGVESWGAKALEEEEATAGGEEEGELEATVGPAVSWAPSSRFWATTTGGFGVTDAAPAFELRILLGMTL